MLMRSVIDRSPTVRARLWDYLIVQQEELAQLIAQRLKAKQDDLRVIFAAQIAISIMWMATDRWHASGGKRASRATAEELMRLLAAGKIVYPRAPRRMTAKEGDVSRRMTGKQRAVRGG